MFLKITDQFSTVTAYTLKINNNDDDDNNSIYTRVVVGYCERDFDEVRFAAVN